MREVICSLDEITMKDIGLIVTSQNIDMSTAIGRAIMNIINVFAELESANTS